MPRSIDLKPQRLRAALGRSEGCGVRAIFGVNLWPATSVYRQPSGKAGMQAGIRQSDIELCRYISNI